MLCHCFSHLALYCLIVLLWVTEPHLRPCVKYWQIKAQRPFTQQRDVTREATILCLPPSVWQDLKYITYLRGRQRTFLLLPGTALSPSCSDKLLFKYKSRNKTHATLLCSVACSIFNFRVTAVEVMIIKALQGKSSLRLPRQKKKRNPVIV